MAIDGNSSDDRSDEPTRSARSILFVIQFKLPSKNAFKERRQPCDSLHFPQPHEQRKQQNSNHQTLRISYLDPENLFRLIFSMLSSMKINCMPQVRWQKICKTLLDGHRYNSH